jgi:hypothetical protein
LNPLDHFKRFQITLSSPFSGFILAQGKFHGVPFAKILTEIPMPRARAIRRNVDFRIRIVPADGNRLPFLEAAISERRRFLGRSRSRQLPDHQCSYHSGCVAPSEFGSGRPQHWRVRRRPMTWDEFLPISMPIAATVGFDLFETAMLLCFAVSSQHRTLQGRQEHRQRVPGNHAFVTRSESGTRCVVGRDHYSLT